MNNLFTFVFIVDGQITKQRNVANGFDIALYAIIFIYNTANGQSQNVNIPYLLIPKLIRQRLDTYTFAICT